MVSHRLVLKRCIQNNIEVGRSVWFHAAAILFYKHLTAKGVAMTEREKLQRRFRNCFSEKRVSHHRQLIVELEESEIEYGAMADELDDEIIYGTNGGRPFIPCDIVKVTPKQVHVRLRGTGHGTLVLSKERLRSGAANHSKADFFFAAGKVLKFGFRYLIAEQQASVGDKNAPAEMEANLRVYGIALSNKEIEKAMHEGIDLSRITKRPLLQYKLSWKECGF